MVKLKSTATLHRDRGYTEIVYNSKTYIFSTNTYPLDTTGGHLLVTNRKQVPTFMHLAIFQKCFNIDKNWFSGQFLRVKRAGDIKNSHGDPENGFLSMSSKQRESGHLSVGSGRYWCIYYGSLLQVQKRSPYAFPLLIFQGRNPYG